MVEMEQEGEYAADFLEELLDIADIDGDLDADRRETLERLAGELLSNPVIEDYRMRVLADGESL